MKVSHSVPNNGCVETRSRCDSGLGLLIRAGAGKRGYCDYPPQRVTTDATGSQPAVCVRLWGRGS